MKVFVAGSCGFESTNPDTELRVGYDKMIEKGLFIFE